MKTSKEKNKIKIDPMIIAMIVVVLFILVIIYFAYKYTFRDVLDKIQEDTRQKIEKIAETIDEPTYTVVVDGEDRYLVVYANQEDTKKQAVRIKSAKRIDGVLSVNVKFEESKNEEERGFALVKLKAEVNDVYVYFEEGELGLNDEYSTVREIEINEFEGGVLIDKNEDTLIYKFGYLNKDGELVIPNEYSSMIEKKDFLITSKSVKRNTSYETLYGILDKEGNVLFDFIYDEIIVLENGDIQVSKSEEGINQTAVYKIDGTMVKDWMDGYVANFNSGYAIISKSRYSKMNVGTVGLVNENYEVVIPRIYDKLALKNIYYQAYKGDKVGLISNSNEILIPFEYDLTTNFNVECDYNARKALVYVEKENEEKELLREIEI